MDTLISLGVLAAFGWSLYALFFGDGRRCPGMRMTFTLLPEPGSGADEIYLEVAAAVTVFILAGRYFEARAKRRSGAALRALMEHGREGRRGAARTAASAGFPIDELAVGDVFVVRPGEKIATDGEVVDGLLRGGRQPAHRRTGAGRGRPRRRGDGRDRQRRRTAGGAGHPGRRRHASWRRWPGWSRQAQSGQGAGAAARRPGVRGVRADRDRPGGRHSRVLAGCGCRRRGGVHRRRRGADHRLPLRARAWRPRPRCWSAPAAARSWAS